MNYSELEKQIGKNITIESGIFITDYTNGINKGLRLTENITGKILAVSGLKVYFQAENGKKYFTSWDMAKLI
jgi:hypothetical protein